jgi:hypothetical protein
MSHRSTLMFLATLLLGIVPATLALLANALYYLRAVTAIPQDAAVTVAWGEVAVLCLLGIAGLIGYVALFFAAWAHVNGRVVIGLLLGVVALVFAIGLGLSPYWLGSPAIVGVVHAVRYFTRRRHQAASERGRSAA